MFADPTRSWKLFDLADLCGMSRATFMRHFQDRLGRSALDLLTDLRMSLAANELKKPRVSIRFGISPGVRRKDGDDTGEMAPATAQLGVIRDLEMSA